MGWRPSRTSTPRHNPYLTLSRPEAPWWHRLRPDFRDLAYVGTTIYTVERAHSLQRRSLESAEPRDFLLLDNQRFLIDTLANPRHHRASSPPLSFLA